MDSETRKMEEIRERLEAHERGVKGAAHDDEAADLRYLLEKLERCREVLEMVADTAVRGAASSARFNRIERDARDLLSELEDGDG